MKKVIMLLAFVACCGLTTMAQGGQRDPAAMKQRYKDMGLSDVQADSVIAINTAFMPQRMALRDVAEADRPAKMKELNDAMNARLEKAIGADLAKKVAEARRGRQGGGGNK